MQGEERLGAARVGFAMALVGALSLYLYAAPQVYRVASASGAARAVGGARGAKGEALKSGMTLSADDSVVTGPNAHVILLSEQGIPVNLCANCSGRVADCIVAMSSRPSVFWRTVLEALRRIVEGSQRGEERLSAAAVRGEEVGLARDRLVITAPRNSALRPGLVCLRWRSLEPPSAAYRVSLYRGPCKIGSWVCVEDSLVLPEGVVEPGETYAWIVRAPYDDTVIEKVCAFRMLPEDSVIELSQRLTVLDSVAVADTISLPILRSLVLCAFDLYQEALEELRKLQSSGDPLAQEASRDLVRGVLGAMGVEPSEVYAFGLE
ncbi:MAG: hypothetical protein ONB23_04050 [candidate division KSB1 bacterium]|nr:hypothetical protein [candidate division KSB1 bacterium]